jgi:hypothetical protein
MVKSVTAMKKLSNSWLIHGDPEIVIFITSFPVSNVGALPQAVNCPLGIIEKKKENNKNICRKKFRSTKVQKCANICILSRCIISKFNSIPYLYILGWVRYLYIVFNAKLNTSTFENMIIKVGFQQVIACSMQSH